MYSNSTSSTAAPSTIANTACYDPLSKCIRLPSISSIGGGILEGSIIEMDEPHFQPGKLLLGEIVEIVIMDAENTAPLAVYNKQTSPSSQTLEATKPTDAMVPTSQSSLTREDLLQKQREQQQLHRQQLEDMLEKHQREKQQLDVLQRERGLAIEDKAQLSAEMEYTHQMENMELQERHQREQAEMTDLIFECASSDAVGGSSLWKRAATAGVAAGAIHRMKKQPAPVEETQTNNDRKQSENTAAGLWNKAAVATVAAGAMNETAQIPSDAQEESQWNDEESQSEDIAAGLWNKAAVASVTAGAINQTAQIASDAKEEPQLNHEESQSENTTAGLWNKAAVATVAAGAMNESNNNNTDDFHKRGTFRTNNTTNQTEPIPASESPELAATTPATAQMLDSSKSIDELRRAEINSVMMDHTLSRQEKQKRLGEIRAKYPKSNNGNGQKKSVRWNQAAVGAVAANTLSQNRNKQPQERKQEAKHSGNLWSRAAATAVSTSTFNTKYQNTKPMSEFTQQLKSNDPSLTAIALDGRKNVTSEEWSNFFDALEGNEHLTDLSLVNCGLTDEDTVPLLLALVENETLTWLNLSKNKELTNSTGKSLLKVIKQSNPVIKHVNIVGTSIPSKTVGKMTDVLADRDDVLKLAKVQEARQRKIKELLAFSASDDISPTSQRLSSRLMELEEESDDEFINDGSTNSSSGKRKKSKKKKKKKARDSNQSQSSNSTGKHSNEPKAVAGAGSKWKKAANATLATNNMTTPRRSNPAVVASPNDNRRKSTARSAQTARNMASLGGSFTMGDVEGIKNGRKMRGECEDCGQKCFQKTLFKSTPLTIPNKVLDGRCLLCVPISK